MKIDDLEKYFVSYVDNNKINLADNCNIEDIIKRHEIDFESDMHKNKCYIKHELECNFKKAINLEKGDDKGRFIALKEQLILKQFIEDESIITNFQKLQQKLIKEKELYLPIYEVFSKNIYVVVLEVIFFYFSNDKFFPDIKMDTEWNKIISLAIDLINIGSRREELEIWLLLNEKTLNAAYAASYFINNGYKLCVENNKIMFAEKSEMQEIEKNIEKEISEIGGWNICQYIFNEVSPLYDKNFRRYNLVRQPRSFYKDGERIGLQKPWGYLLNISLKHFKRYTNIDIKRMKDLIDLATYYIGIFKFQKFSIYEALFISVDDLPAFVKENIFYDRLFTIRQWNPLLINGALSNIFANLFKEYNLEKMLGYSLAEYVKISETILNISNDNFKVFYISDIKDNLNEIKSKCIDKIIDDISHKKKKINTTFQSLDSRITFYEKPLIRLDKNKILLINDAWCSFGFIEALQSKIRKVLKDKIANGNLNLESLIGIELENFIKSKFKEKEIDFYSGYYNQQDECDLILEDESKVVFIELKKKMLTEESQSGNDIKFFDDIAKSLISSQTQLLKHECTLLKHGKIELRKFQNKRKSRAIPTYTLNLNNKKIKKLSLSFSEYGFVNSQETSKTILQLLSISTIKTVDPSKDKELDETRRNIKKMNKYINNLISLNISEDLSIKDIFNNSFFMSVNFFLSILEQSVSKEEFLKKLFLNEHLLTGSSDQYFDYSTRLKNNIY